MSLIKCRTNARMTVLEVANVFQISPQAVYSWEKGTSFPNPAKLVALADLYGCTVDDLLRPDKEAET